MASPYVIDFRGRWLWKAPPDVIWEAMRRVDCFPEWWPWLGQLRLDGSGLVEGATLHGVVSPPLPYRMGVAVRLGRCQPGRCIEATVSGDLDGQASIQLEPLGAGTITEVAWSVEMRQPTMRAVARVAHPVLRWGHDRVVEVTVRSKGLGRALQLTEPPRRLPSDGG